MNSPQNIRSLVSILKDLLTINNYRAEKYKTAWKQTENHQDLCSLFYEKSKQSEDFVNELKEEIKVYETEVESGEVVTGKIHRVWVSIRENPVFGQGASILDACNSEEEAAIRGYDEALHSDVKIPARIRHKLLEQQTAIRKSQDMIRQYNTLSLRPVYYNNSFT